MFILYRIVSFTPARKPFQIDQFTHKNSDFCAISATERSCAALTSKVDRHVLDRFCGTLWCSVNKYSDLCGSE